MDCNQNAGGKCGEGSWGRIRGGAEKALGRGERSRGREGEGVGGKGGIEGRIQVDREGDRVKGDGVFLLACLCVCMCVCERERARERERAGGGDTEIGREGVGDGGH